jgi:spermidine/putrescine transport system ATP-binding protein
MLSGGQRQRVAIARALITNRASCCWTNPLSALDAKLRQNLLVELDHLHDQIGITSSTYHAQSEAHSVSDRIAVMNTVKVLQIARRTRSTRVPPPTSSPASSGRRISSPR